jgi:hypothetical protein
MGILVVPVIVRFFSTRTMPSSVQAKVVEVSVGADEGESETRVFGEGSVAFEGGLGGDVAVGTDVFGSIGVGSLVPPGVGGPGAAGSGEGSVAELGERVGEPAAADGEGAAVDGAIDIDIDMSK